MGCSYWRLVLLFVAFALPVQGEEACYDDSWTYHSDTYSCFRLFRIGLTWIAARNYCHDVQLGKTFGVITRLAKIDDRPTNDFVRTLFPKDTWSTPWIGMHNNTDKHVFRWVDFPDEIPKFNASTWYGHFKPYVAITRHGWQGYDHWVTNDHVCQHRAKVIGAVTCEYQVQDSKLKIICQSEKSPIEAKCQWTYKYEEEQKFQHWTNINSPSDGHQTETLGETSKKTTCSAVLPSVRSGTLNFKMRMYPSITGTDLSGTREARTVGRLNMKVDKPEKPTFFLPTNTAARVYEPDVILLQGSRDVVLMCAVRTGNPFVHSITMTCVPPISNGDSQERESEQTYSLLLNQITRDMDGKTCNCFGNHVTGVTDVSTLTFKVAAKPVSVACQSDLQPNGLVVSCQVDKIYPEALCLWSYSIETDPTVPVSVSVNPKYSHESYVDNDGLHYFNSSCSLNLTRDSITFKPGNLTVQVIVKPHLKGFDDTAIEVFNTSEETVRIDLPQEPLFKLRNKTIQTSYPIHFHENDKIDITCEINSGIPTVYSVTLSCEFPFNNSDGDNKHTVAGITHFFDETASADMNGKNCMCVGNHLTGAIVSSPLIFNITYPPKVKNFTGNGITSEIEVKENYTLALLCMADGNPMPTVRIWKLGAGYLDTSNWQSDNSDGKVEKVLTAECNHNGRYRCSARTAEHSQEEVKDLDVLVRCPPNFCNQTSSSQQQLVVKPGRSETVTLCVVAYPMPDFQLLKNSQTGLIAREDLAAQINTASFKSQRNVTINITDLGVSHLGRYALNYSAESGTHQHVLFFQLTAPPTHCNGKESIVHKVKLGQPAIFTLCVAAYPSPSKLVMQKVIDSGWKNDIKSNASITMGIDFDTLTNVTVAFSEVKATDLGEYRLFDPQEANESSISYLKLRLTEASSSGGGSDIGVIVGAVVAVVIVIILILVVIFVLMRRKKKDKHKESPGSDAKDKDENAVIQIYDNDGFVFEHRTSKDYDDEKNADSENPYSNMTFDNNTSDYESCKSKPAKAEDELVYIKLEFNCTTDKKANSKVKTKRNSKPKEVKKKEDEEDQTVYTDISATATIKIRQLTEEKERRTKEQCADGNSGHEEETVYENIKAGDNVP